jgi:hypothetical protein
MRSPRIRTRKRRHRDAPSRETLDTLLSRWVKTGEEDTGLVAADALRASGHEAAADDLDWSIRGFQWARSKPGMLKRNALLKRIRSEADRGRVLAKDAWKTNKTYVAIFEAPKRRAVLWERNDRTGVWHEWGTYSLKEFKDDVREMMRVLKSDIRYESLPMNVRVAERKTRSRLLQEQEVR